MSHYRNEVQLVGYVGQINHYEEAGKTPFARLTLATTRRYKNKSNEEVEKTTWHTLNCFGKLAEFIKGKVVKGSYLSVSGSLETNEWQTESGEKRTSVVVHVNHVHRLIDRKLQEKLDTLNQGSPAVQPVSKPTAYPDELPSSDDIPY